MFGWHVFIHNHKDHLGKFDAKAGDGYFLGYSFVSKAFKVCNTRRQQVEETYHVTFDKSMEAIRYSLTKVTQTTDVPKVITLNKQRNHLAEDVEGNNTKTSVSITEPSLPEMTQSQITHHASISSHLTPQDRLSRDQYIKLVNIIGESTEGMLTRSMTAKLTASSDRECLFVNFLFEIEPKKVSKELKHLGWVEAMQEELNQFYRNKVWTLGYSQEEGIDYDETFTPVARMEAIRIFLAFATYMNFKRLNSADYVCKLDKAFYGLKKAPRVWYETLSTFLIQNKFVRGRIDKNLFIFKTKGDVLLVQVYVDDIMFGSTEYKLCKQFEKLMTKKFEMSMMAELTYFLGFQIKKDDKGMFICQEKYTRDLLNKYEISNSSSVKTPMVPLNNLGPDLSGQYIDLL
ncbi:retrovirus-related pol polyprotein from transposon TNT 1-94 [Tanacetum coccineum]